MSALFNNKSLAVSLSVSAGEVYIPHIDEKGTLSWEIATKSGEVPSPISLVTIIEKISEEEIKKLD